jgi:NhaA family Na+:H+ antiporter
MLGGIGFTMSIFITNLAFVGGEPQFVSNTVNASKMAILVASLSAGFAGYVWLSILSKRAAAGTDEDLINYGDEDEAAA